MCYYKPNKPPCTCAFLQLIQPCPNVQLFPSPTPHQNPHPLIKVCSNRFIARGVGQRDCERCDSPHLFPSIAMSTSIAVQMGNGNGRISTGPSTPALAPSSSPSTVTGLVSRYPSVQERGIHRKTRTKPQTQIRNRGPMNPPSIQMASALSSSVVMGDSGAVSGVDVDTGIGTAMEMASQFEREKTLSLGKGPLAHLLSPKSVSGEGQLKGTGALMEEAGGAGGAGGGRNEVIVKVDAEEGMVDLAAMASDGIPKDVVKGEGETLI